MKNRKCPNHKACWDYGSCEGCELGKEIIRLHKRIDRLKNQKETLTISRNAWERLARSYEDFERNKWISVEERLPPKYTDVLVYNGSIHQDFICSTGNFYDFYNVTHWMPLPEPPKESEVSENG